MIFHVNRRETQTSLKFHIGQFSYRVSCEGCLKFLSNTGMMWMTFIILLWKFQTKENFNKSQLIIHVRDLNHSSENLWDNRTIQLSRYRETVMHVELIIPTVKLNLKLKCKIVFMWLQWCIHTFERNNNLLARCSSKKNL